MDIYVIRYKRTKRTQCVKMEVENRFDPNKFYDQVKAKHDDAVAKRATHDMILLLTCLKTEITYKDKRSIIWENRPKKAMSSA
jgi:hypothetical protein